MFACPFALLLLLLLLLLTFAPATASATAAARSGDSPITRSTRLSSSMFKAPTPCARAISAARAGVRLASTNRCGRSRSSGPSTPRAAGDFLDQLRQLALAAVELEVAADGLRLARKLHALKDVLHDRGLSTAVGDEGGFAPALKSADDALECIAQAVKRAGYTLGTDIFIALDVASSEFYDPSRNLYVFKKSDGLGRTAEELTAYYQELQKKYPIISIEDGCAENDWLGWEQLTKAMGGNTQLVGDDLFVTNVEFLNQGISRHVANAVLVKVNQIGSLTETLDTVELAKDNKYSAIISHRSGETEDATIADIAVATNAGQIKTGSLSRSDRMAKYNQLLRIEEELGNDAVYGGKIHIL